MTEKSLHLESNYQDMKKKLGVYSVNTILRFMYEAVEAKKWPYSQKFLKAILEYSLKFKRKIK